MLKIAIVTHTLAPSRTPVFAALAEMPAISVNVITCAPPALPWEARPARCTLTVLHEDNVMSRARDSRSNPSVLAALRHYGPDLIVTDGYTPAHLHAFLYARWHRLPHVSMLDGTAEAEQALGALQRLVRRYVLARSDSHVGASSAALALLDGYGLPPVRRFLACVCVDNGFYAGAAGGAEPLYDLLFCGRMEPGKNPLFALELALELGKRLRRPARVLFAGTGSLEARLKQTAALFPGLVAARFAGSVPHAALPALYGAARLFVYPAQQARWGVVLNEACAAGLPVLISPHSAAAHELVRDGENGFVCALDLELWADRAELLLRRADVHAAFAARGLAIVAGYTSSTAAAGLVQACTQALTAKRREPGRRGKYVSRPKIVVVERQLLQYRVSFYSHLRELLAREGMELELLVGEGTPAEKTKRNEAHLDWARVIPTYYLWQFQLCWQPFGRQARDADLVIVMHENKILYNLWLMFCARPRRLAFWGHGANLQSQRPDGWKERFKRWTVNKVDWWFAYTELSAQLIADAGFPAERTTVVENAVDTEEMIALCAQVTPAELVARRRELGLGSGPVGLYLGSLYKEKRLAFLLKAAELIQTHVPGFQLLIVGAGPEQDMVDAAAAAHPWVRNLGPLHGRDKCVALMMADVMLNPGLVGLGILDSFSSGKPMFTTDCGLHSPEIGYLESGRNGVMTANEEEKFAEAVISVLQAPGELARLSKGALASSTRYTVSNMAQRLCDGITGALAMH